MHADQLDLPLNTVRQLIGEQFPRWRSLPVEPVLPPGTQNALFRLGDELVARFPLRGQRDVWSARRRLDSDVAAAGEILGATRFATPEHIAAGEPGHGYLLPWSVQTWLPGRVANEQDLADSIQFARDLAEFISGVRALPTRGRTFSGGRRGGDLATHDTWMDQCFRRSEVHFDVPRVRALWADLRALPRTAPDVITHGDLTPTNLLVDDGRLVGVLDVGDLGPADPALDLVSVASAERATAAGTEARAGL